MCACGGSERTVERERVTTLGVIILTCTAGVALFCTVSALRSAARRKNAYSDAIARFVNGSLSTASTPIHPIEIDAPAWYLSGVQALREGRTRDAVRAFGIAHHADCDLVTAALLTFAGLKASSAPVGDLIQEIVKTWYEMKCPRMRASKADALMLSAMQRTAPPAPAGSELAKFIWVAVGPDERVRLTRLIESGPEWTSGLRD